MQNKRFSSLIVIATQNNEQSEQLAYAPPQYAIEIRGAGGVPIANMPSNHVLRPCRVCRPAINEYQAIYPRLKIFDFC